MTVETITEAKAQLSALIEKVQQGETIIIKKAGKPVAVLGPYVEGARTRKPGALKGKIWIADDFNDLPPEIARAFGMEPDA